MRISRRLLLLATLTTISVALIFSAIQQSQPYLTVTQVVENPNRYQGKEVRVIGLINDAPAQEDVLALQFRLADAQNFIDVVYRGAPPQNFGVGNQAVVVGRLLSADLIEASSILMKCPSKYSDETQGYAGLDYVFYGIIASVGVLAAGLLASARMRSRKKRDYTDVNETASRLSRE